MSTDRTKSSKLNFGPVRVDVGQVSKPRGTHEVGL